jgi:hypothetical protein
MKQITIGEPRPDMLARCQPSNTSAAPESLLTISVCSSVLNLQDGFKSFPSGHSSCKSETLLVFIGLAQIWVAQSGLKKTLNFGGPDCIAIPFLPGL